MSPVKFKTWQADGIGEPRSASFGGYMNFVIRQPLALLVPKFHLCVRRMTYIMLIWKSLITAMFVEPSDHLTYSHLL